MWQCPFSSNRERERENSAESSQTSADSNIAKKRLDKSVAHYTDDLESYQSGSTINRSMLESNPSGNGDITSILRILPNVQYDNNQLSSATPGEISPANISISGGLYYQNNFQLDGLNMNNDLDPASTSSAGGNIEDTRSTMDMGIRGRSQGLSIDTSLLDSISVQDSNISATYGRFTGGLIQANTKKASKDFGAQVSYQITQGRADPSKFSLTKYHVYGDLNDFINSSYASNQPNFTKHIFRASAESKINDKLGIIASFNFMQSIIPLKGYSVDSNARVNVEKTQTRQSANVFLKANYDYSEDLSFELSYAYAPEMDRYYLVNAKDSDFLLKQGGHQLGGKAHWDNALGNLSVLANLNYFENSRSNAATDYKIWLYSSEKNWANGTNGVEEGSFGNEDNKTLNFDVKIFENFKPLNWLDMEHRLSAGVELGYGYAYFKRHQDVRVAMPSYYINLPNGATCTNLEWCTNTAPDDPSNGVDMGDIMDGGSGEITRGYYFGLLSTSKAGVINMYNFTSAAFVEDDVSYDMGKFGEINARLGLRADYESYMKHIPLAPRFSLNYITPTQKAYQTKITIGANRYYGRNLFAYRLMAGRESLDYQYWKIDPADMATSSGNYDAESVPYENARHIVYNGGTSITELSKLKTPYDDELMIGVAQNIFDFVAQLKYIHRFGRDQVMRKCKDTSSTSTACERIWSNDGKSDSDIISLSINNIEPLELLNAKHFIMLSADYTQSKRSFNDYSTTFLNAQLANQIISYNGRFIRYADRPAENFYRPYSVRLTTTHYFDILKTKWTLNNFFRYRSGYDAMVSVSDSEKAIYNGARVDTFRVQKVPFSFSWDMRIGFEMPVYKRHIMFVNVDIYNVLDRKNMAVLNLSALRSSASASAVPTYEVGRQFWLQIGWRY